MASVGPVLGTAPKRAVIASMGIDRGTAEEREPKPPANARLARESRIIGLSSFRRFYSKLDVALTIGERSLADGVSFAIGPEGRVSIGQDCYLTDCLLLVEEEIRIGNYVLVGWNTTISDSDFHPIAPAHRDRRECLDRTRCRCASRGEDRRRQHRRRTHGRGRIRSRFSPWSPAARHGSYGAWSRLEGSSPKNVRTRSFSCALRARFTGSAAMLHRNSQLAALRYYAP